MKNQKLNFITKLSYGMGDIYGGGATTLISMYYLFFLTDVMRISPALAGTAFLISKAWDAVTDPFMGIISDNTRTKLGRRRPYFLAGIILIFVSFVLMWLPVDIQSEGWKFIFVLAAYMFFSTVYTMVMVPYNSVAPELTDDYDARTKLSTYRMIFSNVSGILAGTLAIDIFVDTLYTNEPKTGFFVMAIAFGLFFALPYIMTFLFCKENPDNMNAPKVKITSFKSFMKDYFNEPLKLKPFRSIVMMYLFGFMAQDAVMAMAIYFMVYYLGITSMMTLLVPVYLCMLIAIPFVEKLSLKIGKQKTYMAACMLWILAFSLIPLLINNTSNFMIYLFGALFGAAAAGIQVMVFSMFSDIPDADQLLSGKRREGIYSGMFTFLRKAGGALVMFFIGNSIQWAGYIAPIDQEVNGVIQTVNQAQTPEFLLVLLTLFIAVPVSFILVAFFACRKYKLTKEAHHEIIEFLHQRLKVYPMTAELVETEERLKKTLQK